MVTRLECRSLIYVPDGPGPHPLLCFLHGVGEAASNSGGDPQPLTTVLEHKSPGWHAEHATPFISRFIVICPQLERQRRWERSDAGWIDGLVSYVIDTFHGDPSRCILTGFSYGGEGVFQLAAANMRPWSTIWAVDPALQRVPPIPPVNVRVWVHHGSQQPGGENMPAFSSALALEPAEGARTSRRLVTALREDHTGTSVVAYDTERVYDWLTA